MKKVDRERLEAVAELDCIVCGNYQTQVHHIDTGIGRKKDHQKTIPLCYDCHINGRHGMGKKAWQNQIGKIEFELLDETNEILGGFNG